MDDREARELSLAHRRFMHRSSGPDGKAAASRRTPHAAATFGEYTLLVTFPEGGFDQAVGFIGRQEYLAVIFESERLQVHQGVVLIRQGQLNLANGIKLFRTASPMA
jgi:hypothetical protein